MLDTLIEKAPEPLAVKAMKHGEDNEPEARKNYCLIEKDIKEIGNGDKTTIVGFVDSSVKSMVPVFIMLTPDMIIDRGGEREIVEFKCPYFEIFMSKNRKNRTIKQIAKDFLLKFPNGKEGSFMQASVYALCTGDDISWIHTVYYFNDTTEDKAMIVFTYDIALWPFLEDMVITAAATVQFELQQEPGDIKYRTKPKDKLKLTQAMQRTFFESRIYYLDETCTTWQSLNEETPNNSEEDRPEEPREKSSGSL